MKISIIIGVIFSFVVAQNAKLVPQIGHWGIVSQAIISPDGRYVASTGWDNTVRLWELATGNLTYILRGNWGANSQGNVRGMFFSSDSKILAINTHERKLKFFNLKNWKIIKEKKSVAVVNLSKDWSYFAKCSKNRLEVEGPGIKNGKWSINLKRIKITFRWTTINCVDFSPDNKLVAIGTTSDPDGLSVRVYETLTGKMVYGLRGHGHLVLSVKFSPDGKYLASTSRDASTIVWDVSTGKKIKKLMRREDFLRWNWINWVTFTPDSKYMLIGTEVSAPPTIVVWRTRDWKKVHEFDVRDIASGPAGRASFTTDGKLMVCSLCDKIGLWDFKKRKLIKIFGKNKNGLTTLKFSPSGRFLACGSTQGTLYILDRDLLKFHIFKNHTQSINSLDFSTKNNLLATAAQDGTINLYQFTKDRWKLQDSFKDIANILCVKFSPGSKYLAWGSWLGVTKIARLKLTPQKKFKIKLIRTLKEKLGIGAFPVEDLIFAKKGKIIDIPTSTESGGVLRIWKAKTATLIKKFKTGTNTTVLDISPDFKLLAWGGRWGKNIGILYDLIKDTVSAKLSLGWHANFPSALKFSPSGQFLACGNVWGGIGLFDPTTGELIIGLKDGKLNFVHDYIVWGLDFSPDGKLLASCSTDGFLKLWKINTAMLKVITKLKEMKEKFDTTKICELILTITFPAEKEFVAYNPDNHFWCSKDGEKYIRFFHKGSSYSAKKYAEISGWKNNPKIIKKMLKR